MFIPNQTGQITQNARGAGGSPVTVSLQLMLLIQEDSKKH